MSSEVYQGLLRDFSFELVDMSKDKSLWSDDEFDRGRLSMLHQVLMMIRDYGVIFGVPPVEPMEFDVGEWFRLGSKYWEGRE